MAYKQKCAMRRKAQQRYHPVCHDSGNIPITSKEEKKKESEIAGGTEERNN